MPCLGNRLRRSTSFARPLGLSIAFALALVAMPALTIAPARAQGTPPPAKSEPKSAPKVESMPPLPEPGKGAAAPSPLKPGDAFGEPVTLPERTIVYLKGHTNWDAAFETLVDAFKSLDEYLAKQNIKPSGPYLTVYTQTDDTGFTFQAAAPVASAPANPPKGDIAVGQAPAGNALKFVHRGSYDAMDTTYEAITNFLDDKQLDAKDLFVEEYTTDPVKTDPNDLVINVYVPIK